jgi:AraC family transcriptional regulator, transcriptional activator of pobA
MRLTTSDSIPGVNMSDLQLKGFKIHKMTMPKEGASARGRRDYFKLGLVSGSMTVHTADKSHKLDGTALFFINPNRPHTVEVHSGNTNGYACIFTQAFISGRERAEILKNSPLFQADDCPLIHLNRKDAAFMTDIFERMIVIHNGDYHFKGQLIQSCLELIIQEGLRLQPSKQSFHFNNAAARITHLFTDLLEKQFPIERPGEPLKLKSPQDFATGLSVHVNYLNRAVKEVTGKPTSAVISERITAEAKALLKYTDWNIADIAYALGFEYPTYFNNYFKRITGSNPGSFRN